MKSTSLRRFLAAATLAATILAPAAALAHDDGTKHDEPAVSVEQKKADDAAAMKAIQGKTGSAKREAAVPKNAEFCAMIAKQSEEVKGRLGDGRGKLGEKRKENADKLAKHRTEQKSKLAELRTRQADGRGEQYTKLDALATTSAQKAAVAAFKKAADAAIAARRAAVDSANAAFKAAVDKTVSARKTQIDAALAKFEAAAKAAVAKAQADCAAGLEPADIKGSFRTAMEAARTQLMTDLQAVDKTSDGVEAAREARRTAVDKAYADFKTAMEKARADLKAAIKPALDAGSKDAAKMKADDAGEHKPAPEKSRRDE